MDIRHRLPDPFGSGGGAVAVNADRLLRGSNAPARISPDESIQFSFIIFRKLKTGVSTKFPIRLAAGLPQDPILGIHGAESPEIFGRLLSAGISYLLVWREEHICETSEAGREVGEEMLMDCFGSGCMKALSMAEAETLSRDALPANPRAPAGSSALPAPGAWTRGHRTIRSSVVFQ